MAGTSGDEKVTPETSRIMRDVLESLRLQAACGQISQDFYRRMKEAIESSPRLKVT